MLFFKTLYFLYFYDYIHEIHTAYYFISCHYMYVISAKSNYIFDYKIKAKQLSILCAFLLLKGVHTALNNETLALSFKDKYLCLVFYSVVSEIFI